jgi:peptidoglycan/xylan/chitin deacetylase (PgdA/CDA1 family)
VKNYNLFSIIIALVITTSILIPPHSFLSNKSAQAYSSCNCVIFRLDDIEDQGNADKPNIAIMQHFIDKNHKLSSEIIVNNFGNSGTNGNVYKTVKQGYDAGLFELGIHGFNHVKHSQLSEEQQKSDFAKAKNKLISLFNDPNLRLFVPPFNDFDSDTIKAMAENKLDIFSSSYSSERLTTNIYKVSNSFETDNSIIQLSEVTVFDNDTGQSLKRRVYHVPFDISLFNMIEPTGTLSGQNLVDAVVSKADTQIANTGFAVITLHPTDISPYNPATGSWTDTVDDAKFQALKNIVTALEAKGYGFSYMSDVTPAPSSNVVPGTSQTALLTLNTIANVGWGADVTVTGKLTDSASGTAIDGATITFDGTGATNLQPVTTNADGTFTAKGTAPSTVATGWKVEAHFAGDNHHDKVDSTTRTYSTTKHAIGLSISVPTSSVAPGTSYKVSGTLTDTTAGGKQLESKTITFTADAPITISDKTTNTNGFYSATQAAPNTAGTYNIQSHFAGDDLYNSKDSQTKTLTVS